MGTSLARFSRDGRLRPVIAFENTTGLPELYNRAIDASADNDILVFIHDDVWIEDFFFVDRVIEGLKNFEVIGLAGNRKRWAEQLVWAAHDKLEHTLSGAIAHGDAPLGSVSMFGPIGAKCELLDGVFIAARAVTLRTKKVRFDTRFDFHFYDLDFCRTARARGLTLGTFPLAVTHRSHGDFESDGWQANSRLYLEKWGS